MPHGEDTKSVGAMGLHPDGGEKLTQMVVVEIFDYIPHELPISPKFLQKFTIGEGIGKITPSPPCCFEFGGDLGEFFEEEGAVSESRSPHRPHDATRTPSNNDEVIEGVFQRICLKN